MQIRHGFIFSTEFFGPVFAINFFNYSSNVIHQFMVKRILLSWALLVVITTGMSQDQLSRTQSERLFKKGTELIDHANYGAAREVFAEFLNLAERSDARRAEAEYFIAYSALNLGHSDGEKRIEDFVGNNPSHPRSATAYYDLANFFYVEKSYSKAISYYKKVNFQALGLDQQLQGRFKFGYSYFNLKKLPEALEQFNFVKIQNSSYTPAASYYAGFIEYSNADYDAALVDLKRAELNPAYAGIVPYLIANVYYKQRKYDDLINYANVLKTRTNIVEMDEIAALVADSYYFKSDFKRAANEYDQYLATNITKAEGNLLFRAGYSHYSIDQPAKATEYLKSAAAKSDSIGYYASYYLGIVYLQQGNKQYAANAFDYSRRYKADQKLAIESLFQFAKVSYDLGKADQAIAEFEVYLQAAPGGDRVNEVKELLAQAYVNGNNYNKAIEYIESLPRRSTAVDQAYQKATFLKGTELFNKDEYTESITLFDKSLKYPVNPVYVALASFWAGESNAALQQFEQAIPYYQKVISLGDKAEAEVITRTRYGLGYAYYNTKQYEQALYNFKEFTNKANRSQPAYSDALIRLADCYYVSKAYQDAITYYNRARAANSPDDDYILFQTGVINGILRKYADARNQFNILISTYAKSPYRDEAIFQRAQFEIEQGNYQAAVDGLSVLIREGGGSRFLPYAYMRRAASYYNLKQLDKTVDDYKAVLNQFPTHPVAQQVLLPLQEALTGLDRGAEFEQYLSNYKQANPENKNLEVVEFESGKNQYFSQNYQRAVTTLNQFIANYSTSAKIPEANYYLAESYYRLSDFDKALPIYVQLSNDNSFTMANRVVGRVAEIEFRKGQYENAIASFRRLERLATNKREVYTALSGMMESYYLLAQYDSADVYANHILERGNVNAGAQNKATLYLGKSAMARGDFETAKDEFLNTLNTARDEFGAEAKYLLAEIQFQSKQYKQCYETLISLNNDFAAYDAWVGKSYLLLADYALATNDVFQAKATLQSLIDHFPLETIKLAAKDKLDKLEQAEKLKEEKAVQQDTIDNR